MNLKRILFFARVAIQMNVASTKKVIDLVKRMRRLEAFVHVSTAYSNCIRQAIGEEVYKPPIQPDMAISFGEWISDELAEMITPSLIRPWPNTYTYTKSIAESLVIQECELGKIPCSIVRPSIVGASWQDPFPGWIDNFNGPTALLSSVGKGLLRCMYGNKQCAADIIPVEFPVNMMIVAG